jgi:hypothetical protein
MKSSRTLLESAGLAPCCVSLNPAEAEMGPDGTMLEPNEVPAKYCASLDQPCSVTVVAPEETDWSRQKQKRFI